MANRKAFVPPLSRPGQLTRMPNSRPVSSASNPLLEIAVNAAKEAVYNGVQDVAATQAQRFVEGVASKIPGTSANPQTNNRPPKTSYQNNNPKGEFNMGSSSGNSSYALSPAPNPGLVKLNTGIEPNTYTSDYLEPTFEKCSPLHVSGNLLKFPDYAGARLLNYFNTIIGFDLQSNFQGNVGFNLNVSTNFTVERILTAFNALLFALQMYYYHASIITYHSESTNKNQGLIFIRSKMTPAIMEQMSLLKRRLEDTPTPPNLMELVRYLNSNFYSGPNQGSPIIKFYPFTFNANMVSEADLILALTNLNTANNNEVFSLIRRCVPKWTPKKLVDVPLIPIYDPNFCTIFANAPFLNTPAIGGSVYQPNVANSEQTINYNTYTTNLDGLAYALTSVSIGAATEWSPGLMITPPGSGSTTGNTRKSFYTVDNIAYAFYNSKDYPFLIRSRQDSYSSSDDKLSLITPHLFGTDKCKGVSADTVRESANASMDYLFSLDTIKSSGRTITNPINSSRRRGK